MSIAASEQPNVRPVVLAEMQVAVAMRGPVLYSTTPVQVLFEKEGATFTITTEGDANTFKKED